MDDIEFMSLEDLAKCCDAMSARLRELGERMAEAERAVDAWQSKAQEMASAAGWENSDYLSIDEDD